MSIHGRDTAVVIFKTCGADGRSSEYRVRHVKHPSALTANPNYPSPRHALYNREAVLSIVTGLGHADRFTDADAACKRAIEIQNEMPHVMIEDYPILFLNFGQTHFPATDERRAARRYRRNRLPPPQIPATSSRWDDIIEAEFIELENL